MQMLQKLREAFLNGRIEYFWDEDLNLLEYIGIDQMRNMAGRINYIIKSIERNIANDEYAITKWVCKYFIFFTKYKYAGPKN